MHQVKSFLQTLRNEGLSYSSIAGYHTALAMFYDELIANHFPIKDNPFRSRTVTLPKGCRRPQYPTRGMEENDVLRLLAAPNRRTLKGIRDYALLCCYLGLGLRRNEALRLTKDDLRVNERGQTVVSIRNAKNCAYRETVCSAWVADGLWDHVRVVSGLQLFSLKPTSAHKLFKSYLKRTGLDVELYSLHSCRKTAITALLDAGVPHREVKYFSGHTSVRMVERYDEERNTVDKNPGFKLVYGGKGLPY